MNIKELYEFYRQHPVVTTDSRQCPEGSIFFALKGESFDGNKFAVQALEKGCALAVIDDPNLVANLSASPASANLFENVIPSPSGKGQGGAILLVPDVLKTFKMLAREHRRQFHIPVIGITGTNGKTTTKELIRAVLAEKYNVMATEGNFNNDVGVPKTLFRLTPEHEIAVIEMGASHPGDIRTLAETAEPTCGLITNVGKAHLQGFGTLKGVLQTKGELYDFLATHEESVIFINADNELLTSILPETAWVSPYSTNINNADGCVVAQEVKQESSPYLHLRWCENALDLEERGEERQWYEVATHLIGSYNIDNVLAAITVGLQFAVAPGQICHAIENYVPSNNRSQLMETAANHLIVDAYNANPTSMEAALENFRQMQVGPKMVIVGEMRELGSSSDEEHRHIVKVLKKCQFDSVWLIGDAYADIKCHYRKFHDVEEAKKALSEERPQGFYVLIKGSNSTHLYELPEWL
ncbi:MAG: UDP-N-acetylmuramoyl-tripeptide--D-alanyl-D-alanine ligase [Prevotella sp.]|nr:UDP-N-acetylmuramoyl-tripeptide--D-alanyl-D-alanine ligase [Prevotella sp.]